MIWFACKNCKKVIGRPESSAGALVFCICGHGSRVPWESTTAAPPVESIPAAPRHTVEPIRFDAPDEPPLPPISRRERRSRHAPIDPNSCFNHSSIDKADVCAACGLGFCNRCLTTFQNAVLCTACKNYRSRLLQRRPDSSKLALVSFLVALAAGPALFALIPVTMSRHSQSFLLLALIPPLLAIAAGVVSLRWIYRGPDRAGQHLAISGISLAAVVAMVTQVLVCFGQKIW